MDGDHVPDFFDYWMEEYVSKSLQISLERESRRPSTQKRNEADGKDSAPTKERER